MSLESLAELLTSTSYVRERKEILFDTPVESENMPKSLQKKVIKILNKFDFKVEVFQEDRGSVKFKVRQLENERLELYPGSKVPDLLRKIREALDNGGFRRSKLFYLDYTYAGHPEVNSINVVYNPRWRKYESFEILFRSKTQLRRSRG